MFKEINKMTGKVFENPENQQNMKVQVWLVEQDFPSTVSGRTTFYVLMGICLKENLVLRFHPTQCWRTFCKRGSLNRKVLFPGIEEVTNGTHFHVSVR